MKLQLIENNAFAESVVSEQEVEGKFASIAMKAVKDNKISTEDSALLAEDFFTEVENALEDLEHYIVVGDEVVIEKVEKDIAKAEALAEFFRTKAELFQDNSVELIVQ